MKEMPCKMWNSSNFWLHFKKRDIISVQNVYKKLMIVIKRGLRKIPKQPGPADEFMSSLIS